MISLKEISTSQYGNINKIAHWIQNSNKWAKMHNESETQKMIWMMTRCHFKCIFWHPPGEKYSTSGWIVISLSEHNPIYIRGTIKEILNQTTNNKLNYKDELKLTDVKWIMDLNDPRIIEDHRRTLELRSSWLEP